MPLSKTGARSVAINPDLILSISDKLAVTDVTWVFRDTNIIPILNAFVLAPMMIPFRRPKITGRSLKDAGIPVSIPESQMPPPEASSD